MRSINGRDEEKWTGVQDVVVMDLLLADKEKARVVHGRVKKMATEPCVEDVLRAGIWMYR